MNLFKRIEVILLLLLAAGGAVWVLSGKPDRDDYELGAPTQEETVLPDNQVHRCTLERDHGNARLDIELRFSNKTTRRLIMQPPQVRLLAGGDKEVPPFFLPFEAQPEIPAGSTQEVRLRYWLAKSDVQGDLTLEVQGQRLEVKSAAPLDLEKLKNKEPRTFTETNWRL